MKPAPLFLTIAGAALLLSAAARADSEKARAYELKNRSSFHADADGRIPFWPIGWKRPAINAEGISVAPVTTAKFQIEPGHFSVTSILLGNPALATINGRTFEEGEVLPVVRDSERLRVVVRAIRDGGVTLDYEGQKILVPMKRQDIGTKQSQQKAEPVEFTIKLGAPAQK